MGSLKRKNASLPSSSSSSSSKRASASRGDPLPASGNGYALRRTHTHTRPSSDPSSNGTPPRAARPIRDTRASGSSSLPPSGSLALDDGKREEEEEEEQQQQQHQRTAVAEQDSPNAEDRSGSEDDADHVCSEDESAENSGPLVPNHAGWFSWDKIHEIERRGLPEFFNSKSKLKTPSLYIEYRNLLMRKYLENQDNLFTWAEASSMALSEDIKEGFKEAAKGIFEFLDHWGLINSKAIRNSKAGVMKQKCALEPLKRPLLPSLYRFDKSDAPSTSRPSTAAEKPTIATNIADTAITDLQGGIEGPIVDYHCNSCSADCSKRRFHCQKQADFDLCPECYSEEKFSFGITTTDFILMEAVADASDTSSGGWSDQETLLLLEALELYGDNFNEIADHVATKTKAQCILHFIRLPIEDPFLEGSDLSANLSNLQPVPDLGSLNKVTSLACQQADDQDGGLKNHVPEIACEKALEEESPVLEGSKNGKLVEDGNKEDKDSVATAIILAAAQTAGLCGPEKSIAFSGCGNPVMALASFLAALVEPDIVVRSAEVALKILSEHASASQLAEKNSYRLENDLKTIETPQDGAAEEGVPTESDTAKTTLTPCEDSISCGEDNGKPSPDDSFARVTTLSSTERIKNAASTALAAAAVKAKFLADKEEWEVLRLAASVVDSQCKKVETKMRLLKDLDATLQREHNSLEKSRQRLFAERIQMAKSRGIPGPSSGQLLGVNAALPAVQKLPHAYAGAYPGICMVPRALTPSASNDMLRSNVFTQGPSTMPARPPLTHLPHFAHPSGLQRFTRGPA